MRSLVRRGFTLIELLVVIAISGILFAIIAIPLTQSLNLTRDAQAFADAQSAARVLITEIEQEISNAAGVRDNTGLAGQIAVVVPGFDGSPEVVVLNRAKLDIIRPAQGDPGTGPSGAFVNPDTGREDPTLQAPRGQIVLPGAAGTTIKRYWIGLRDPFIDTARPGSPDIIGYLNPYDGILQARSGERDNLYVLYEAEVQPYVYNAAQGRWLPNEAFFETDGNFPILDDPAFFQFIPSDYSGGTLTPEGQAKAQRMRNWQRQARIVTQVSRFDMIQALYDLSTREPLPAPGNPNQPQIISLVTFQPQRVASEPAEGLISVRTGEETDNAEKIGPDVFETRYAGLTNVRTILWPSTFPATFGVNAQLGQVRGPWPGSTRVNVGRTVSDAAGTRFSVFSQDPEDPSINFVPFETFDITVYQQAQELQVLAQPPYPFTAAIQAADGRSGWLSNPDVVASFVPMVPDIRRGRVVTSFSIQEVGTDLSIPVNQRGPVVATGAPFTPNNDPDVGAGNWFDAQFQTPNRRFNKLWADWESIPGKPDLDRADYVKRFVDLRFVPQPDGTPSPLGQFLRASIVPGTEVVVGPDQIPGPNYGNPVRYTRVTQRPVGPNQYLINYTDLPEPDWAAVGFAFGGNPYEPGSFDPQSILSAVLQPRFRRGYLEFNSRFGEPLPAGNIFVTYRFQLTEPNDVVAVDYDSSEVMEILLTIRNFPQSNRQNPQPVTVQGAARVRNFQR